MDFPIVDLLDDDLSLSWLTRHFHPQGLQCPHCSTAVKDSREFRKTTKSQLIVYRCLTCDGIYNLYSGTAFEGRYLTPKQVILLLRGICKGEPSAAISREINTTRQTVLSIRRAIQNQAIEIQPDSALPDLQAETDEMFQNAGEKRLPSHKSSRPAKAESQQEKGTWNLRQ